MVTVTGAVKDEVYNLYQILYLDDYGTPASPVYDADGNITGGNYAYKFNPAWTKFIDYSAEINGDTKFVNKALSVDDKGYVTWVGDSTSTRAATLAKLALLYAKKENISPLATIKADGTNPVVFSNLKLGYFLVDTSLGSLCALNTTNPNTTVREKNPVPQNDKDVKEETWGDKNDASIGDTVEFRCQITIGVGTDHLVFHDKMTEGLTLDAASIQVYNDAYKTNPLSNDGNANYVVKSTAGKEDKDTENCTFHITFTDAYLSQITQNTTLYVFYNATLNEHAKVKTDENTNTSHLSYGDEKHTTPDSQTITHTWEIPVFKYHLDATNQNAVTPLAGAVFELRKVPNTAPQGEDPEAGNPAVTLVNLGKSEAYEETVKDSEGNETKVTNTYAMYRVAKEDETTGTTTQITTDATGRFRIQGLDSGTYELVEVGAPTGYNRLTTPITVRIMDTGVVQNNNTQVEVISIQNGTGSKLPSTGGMGTTVFYVVGAILLVGAGVLLVTKRRMSAQR